MKVCTLSVGESVLRTRHSRAASSTYARKLCRSFRLHRRHIKQQLLLLDVQPLGLRPLCKRTFGRHSVDIRINASGTVGMVNRICSAALNVSTFCPVQLGLGSQLHHQVLTLKIILRHVHVTVLQKTSASADALCTVGQLQVPSTVSSTAEASLQSFAAHRT